MLQVLLTLDYEIHGNGEGCPYELMVEPANRMLALFDAYGAKLTIMADIAEILKFKEYAEEHRTDRFHYHRIVAQLQDAVRRGHDVQLHIHSSYYNAKYDGCRWEQDWADYDLAGLNLERLNEMIGSGKSFLESIVRPANPDYRCVVFRAANWSVSPSRNVVQALVNNGLRVDTSVFKYGRRDDQVTFDYTAAYSEMVPWRGDPESIWKRNPKGEIWEVPIYCENRRMHAFVSPTRIYRVLQAKRHPMPDTNPNRSRNGDSTSGFGRFFRNLGQIVKKHAWKADFNQCTGRQLIRALNRAEARHADSSCELPFVVIGHSKLFTRFNERSLRPFLDYVASHPSRFSFATFGALNLDRIANGHCQSQVR